MRKLLFLSLMTVLAASATGCHCSRNRCGGMFAQQASYAQAPTMCCPQQVQCCDPCATSGGNDDGQPDGHRRRKLLQLEILGLKSAANGLRRIRGRGGCRRLSRKTAPRSEKRAVRRHNRQPMLESSGDGALGQDVARDEASTRKLDPFRRIIRRRLPTAPFGLSSIRYFSTNCSCDSNCSRAF